MYKYSTGLMLMQLLYSDIIVIYSHDTISMLHGTMLYCAKLTGEDMSHYLNKIESVRLRKA